MNCLATIRNGQVTRLILEALPDWFGIADAREEYIRESAGKPFFCAYDGERPIGFLYLKQTGRDTVELYVMGVLKEFHRQGTGRALVNAARRTAREMGWFSFNAGKDGTDGQVRRIRPHKPILSCDGV